MLQTLSNRVNRIDNVNLKGAPGRVITSKWGISITVFPTSYAASAKSGRTLESVCSAVYDNSALSARDIIFKRALSCIVTRIVESMQHNRGETIERAARSCGFEIRLNGKVNLWTE